MAPLRDPDILAQFRQALQLWDVTGYIVWTRGALERLHDQMDGYTIREVGRLMYEHVVGGGEIDQVKESRHEFSEYAFHYDFRFAIERRLMYIETRLIDDDPDDPVICVVNIHPA